ncbi:MAG: Ig-like domain-containing protein [Chloroflexota bacterium]
MLKRLFIGSSIVAVAAFFLALSIFILQNGFSVFAFATPVATDNSYSTAEETELTGNVVIDDTGNGVDSGDAPLTASVDSPPITGTFTLSDDGSFAYTPPLDYNGNLTFTYSIEDGGAGTAVDLSNDVYNEYGTAANDASLTLSELTIEAWVNPVLDSNPWRTIVMKGGYGYALAITRPECGAVSTNQLALWINGGCGNSIFSTGTITEGVWQHVAVTVDSGGTTFYINGVESGTSANTQITNNSGSLYISRQGQNCNCNFYEGGLDEVRIWNVARTQTEIQDNMNQSLTGSETGLVAYYKMDDGTGTTLSDSTTNSNDISMVNFESGTDWITSTATINGETSNLATVSIDVTAVNDLPTATDNGYFTNEDEQLIGNVITDDTGLGADNDVDGDVLTATVVTDVTNGSLTLNPEGDFLYTPTNDFSGFDSFVYNLTDGSMGAPQITATVQIEVGAVNDPPVAVEDNAETDVNTSISIDVLANDTDVDTGNLTIDAVGLASFGEAIIESNEILYDPDLDFSGADSFTYTVSDGTLTDTATVNILVSLGPDIDSGFRPSTHGYAFENYGTTKAEDTTPSSTVLIEMFGAASVCKVGTLSQDATSCILDTHVHLILADQNDKTYGQAYGMVVTTMRFFADVELPSDILGGSNEDVTAIVNDIPIRDHIGRYTSQQGTEPVVGSDGWLRSKTAAEVITELRTQIALGSGGDPYLMLLYAQTGGNSHSLFPYRVIETAVNQYDVYVYDANYPQDDSRVVSFNLTTNSWAYQTEIPVTDELVDLSGIDATSLIDLRALSGHQPTGLKFVGASSSSRPEMSALSLFATGEPLAFTTDNCFSIVGGVDFDNSPDGEGKCNATSNVPNSGPIECMRGSDGLSASDNNRNSNQLCGMGEPVTEDLQFTMYEDTSTSSRGGQSASGHTLTMITNLGHVVAIDPSPTGATTGNLTLNISPDAETITIDPDDSDGTLPELSLAVRGTTANQPSLLVTITAEELSSGSSLTAQVDPDTGFLFFQDNDGNNVTYSISIEQVNSDGSTATFANEEIILDGEAAYLDFGNWSGGSMELVVDEDGDGFGNDQPVLVENSANSIYLPLIQRN